MSIINAELACRLRQERGLRLPANAEYSTPRLRYIAQRESEILDELETLDKELEFLRLSENKESTL